MEILPVSVLIPTMNRPKGLLRTLNGYLNADYTPAQIVIVDQSQNPEVAAQTRQLCEDLSGSTEICYIFQSTPSLTKARNLALKYAREEILIISDDDVDVYTNTVKNVYDTMLDTSIAMIAGIDDNSAKSTTKVGYLLGTRSFAKRKIGHVTRSMLGCYPDDIRGTIPTEWAMGYFFILRRSLLEKWNVRWDEKLTSYAYGEDLDFSYSYSRKAAAEGLRCILSDKIRVCHLASKEYRIPSQRSTYLYILNRAYLRYKHRPGVLTFLSMYWCNFWRIIEQTIRKTTPGAMARAVVLSLKEHKKIAAGDLEAVYAHIVIK